MPVSEGTPKSRSFGAACIGPGSSRVGSRPGVSCHSSAVLSASMHRCLSKLLVFALLSFAWQPVLAASTPVAPPATKPAARPAARPLDDKSLLGDIREEHAMIPMRDGVRLSTWLYFPPGPGPFGVIYQQRYVDITTRGQRAENVKLA